MKSYLYISVLIIPLLSIMVIYQSRKIHKQKSEIYECHSLYKASNVANNETFSQFGRLINIIHLSSLERIDRGYLVTDNEDKKYDLLDIVNSPKLIFKFSERHCHSCVQNIIEKLKDLEQSIGSSNIIIVAERISAENLQWLRAEITLNMGVYYCSTKNQFISAIEKNDIPYIFTLDKNGEIQFPLPVTDDLELISDSYFSNIISYFNHLN